MNKIKLDLPKESHSDYLKRMELQLYQTLYTSEEMFKAINALREKYNISRCDGLPYQPKGMKVKLIGEVK